MTKEIIKYKLRLAEESYEDAQFLYLKFIICDFNDNRNKIRLDRDGAEELLHYLNGMPLVGRLIKDKDGVYDFTGHNLKKQYKFNKDTNKLETVYYFDTEAYGWLYDSAIEEIDGKEYITAKAKVWKRYSNAVEVIKRLFEDDNMESSWELFSEEYYMDNNIKVLTKYLWWGNCLLGSNVEPAYPCAGVIDIMDYESSVAPEISQVTGDFNKDNNEGGQGNMSKTQETSALTSYDLNEKIWNALNPNRWSSEPYFSVQTVYPEEHKVIFKDWNKSEDIFYYCSYEVTNDEVALGEHTECKLSDIFTSQIKEIIEAETSSMKEEYEKQITELQETISTKETELSEVNNQLQDKVDSIVKIGEEISELKGQLQELEPIKSEYERIQEEARVKELAEKQKMLKEFATKGGFISEEELETSEELKKMIDELDESGLKIFKAERIINAQENNTIPVITSSTTKEPIANLDNEDDVAIKSATSFVMSCLK